MSQTRAECRASGRMYREIKRKDGHTTHRPPHPPPTHSARIATTMASLEKRIDALNLFRVRLGSPTPSSSSDSTAPDDAAAAKDGEKENNPTTSRPVLASLSTHNNGGSKSEKRVDGGSSGGVSSGGGSGGIDRMEVGLNPRAFTPGLTDPTCTFARGVVGAEKSFPEFSTASHSSSLPTQRVAE